MSWREKLYIIIFESDTPAGKAFDVALIYCIILSVAAVVLESVDSVRAVYGSELLRVEWFFTFLFTVEYLLRLIAVPKRLKYARSFFGIIDLFAILPTYVSLLIPGAQSLLVVRTFRLLRMFRIFKLSEYLGEAQVLYVALKSGRPKVTVFFVGVLATVITVGALMYLVEGPKHGFSSIPISIYWSIVTMTTVGFGDITPKTALGQAIASALMIMGYSVIAVPTGIVGSELMKASKAATGRRCEKCGLERHEADALHCKYCGSSL